MSRISWEALHSGPWHSVPVAWREVHSLAAVSAAIQTLHEINSSSEIHSYNVADHCQACLRSLDVALLVGGPCLGRLIHPLLDHIHTVSAQSVEDPPSLHADVAGHRPLGPDAALADVSPGQSEAWCNAALQAHETEAWRAKLTQSFGDRCSWLEAIQAPGLMQFEEKYMSPQKPVLLKGAADAWPAMTRRVQSYDLFNSASVPW